MRQATTLNDKEARRDFIANGYGLSTCGSEGFSNKRDKYGVSRRQGSWAHAFEFCGFDDRPEIERLYGDTLELCNNSWATWNSGPRDIYNSAQYVPNVVSLVSKIHKLDERAAKQWLIQQDILNESTNSIMIPKGSWWARSKDVRNRSFIAKSSL